MHGSEGGESQEALSYPYSAKAKSVAIFTLIRDEPKNRNIPEEIEAYLKKLKAKRKH